MCGHVGIAGKLELKDEATLKRLLVLDYFRGPDSTGVAVIDKEGETSKIVKIASHPLDLFDTFKFKDALSGYKSSVFMGHNRAATRGQVNSVNAHPYEFGHIIGCHNGTLSAATFLKLKQKLGEDYDVDSQAVFASIEKFGIKATVNMFRASEDKTSCPDAWALVWVDLKEKTLNFLRNGERPFWYAYSEEFDRVFWASEWPMIDYATKLSAQGYKLYQDSAEGYTFWQTPEDTHFKFDLDKLRAGGDSLPSPIVGIIKGKALAPVVTYTQSGTAPFPSHFRNGGTDSKKKTPTGTSHSDSPDTFVHLFGDKKAPFAGFIIPEKFADLAKYGCSWCGADVEFDDVGVSIFEHNDTVLCPSCGCGDKKHSRVYTSDLEDKIKAVL